MDKLLDHMGDNFLIFTGVFAAVISVLVGVIIGVVVFVELIVNYNACQTVKSLSGVETNVSLSMGCLVKYRGEWVDVSVMTKRKQDITVK